MECRIDRPGPDARVVRAFMAGLQAKNNPQVQPAAVRRAQDELGLLGARTLSRTS